MLKKYIFAVAALFLLVPCIASAQEDPDNKYNGQFEVKKEVKDYNYETMSGTLSIESFLKGELTSSGKPLDIVLVLDASGSMGWEYRGQTNVEYKSKLPIKYNYNKTKSWNGWKGSDFLGYNVGSTESIAEFDHETEYYLRYPDTDEGKYYPIYFSNHRKEKVFGWDNMSVYFMIDGGRYYLNKAADEEDLEEMTDTRIAAIIAAGPEEPRQNGDKSEYASNPRKEGMHQTDYIMFNRPLYYLSEETISKMDKLKESVNSFIDLIAADAVANNIAHRISIVQFASGYLNSNHIKVSDYKASFTQLIMDFTSTTKNKSTTNSTQVADTDKINKLKNAINGLVAKGATSADYGMQTAKELISSKASAADKSEKVVIMFTDGEPNHHSGFDKTVANNTISISKGLKEGTTTSSKGKVKVYTVGLFSDLNSTQMKNVNPFMDGVSSNYPSATAYTSLGTGSNLGFFQDASDATSNDLSTVFARIANEIKNISSLDSHTLVRDVMNPVFTLPNGISAGSIKIYTAPLSSISGTEYTFGTKTEITGNDKDFYGILLTTGDNPTLEVSGFDYKTNWCGDNGGTPHGIKLIIELPFHLKPTVALMDSTSVSTSKNDSGVYSEYGTYLIKSIRSEIDFKSLTIHMAGLQKGESAILELEKKTGTSSSVMVNRIVLTGVDNKGAEVTHRIPFLDPEATYTVTAETGWSWTYTPKSDTVQTKDLSNETDTDLHLYFKNESISQERIPRKAESILRLK